MPISKAITFIKWISPKRIWHQIFISIFFLIVIPLFILEFLLLQSSQRALQTTIQRDYKEIAVHASGKIREHIQGIKQSFYVTAAILGTLPADPWRQETTIVELALRNPDFQRISALNIKGVEMATSELGTPLKDYSAEKAFQEAIRDNFYLSDVRFSPEYIPFLKIAAPIKQIGTVKGVLLADVSLRSVWDVVDGIQVGKMGRAYLFDTNGRIIAHTDKKLILNDAEFEHAEVIKDIAAGHSGIMEDVDKKGNRWLTSYAPVEELNWGLFISQPEAEAYSFLNIMKIQFLSLLVWSVLTTLLISVVFAHYISSPIKNMIEGTRRISQGDFSYSFPIRSRSEIDKLLFSFNRMRHKLRKAQEMEKLSIIGKAATAIAHELKNSLQLIDTFVQLLPHRYEDKAFIKDFSETIPKEIDSWNHLLKNMVSYSIESPFVICTMDVNELVKEIAQLINLKSQQSSISVSVDLDPALPLIKGNSEKLKQVFLNLLTNALEATPPGGNIYIGTMYIRKSRLSSSDYVRIEVANTGLGIDEERIAKIFDPFFTTKIGGLGLGLAISKDIIQLHHGTIEAKSIKGEKTSFVVKLPRGVSLDAEALEKDSRIGQL